MWETNSVSLWVFWRLKTFRKKLGFFFEKVFFPCLESQKKLFLCLSLRVFLGTLNVINFFTIVSVCIFKALCSLWILSGKPTWAVLSLFVSYKRYLRDALCPGWNCLNFLQVFVGYQANFSWFYKFLKETCMHLKLHWCNLILSSCL